MLICVSRIYLGVHDVGDVLGGILLGALTLYVWVKLDVAGRLIAGLELFGLPKLVLLLLVAQVIFYGTAFWRYARLRWVMDVGSHDGLVCWA